MQHPSKGLTLCLQRNTCKRMVDATPKKVISFRLDPGLIEWLDAYSKHFRMTRTSLIEELLTALREKRLYTLPDTKPNPFPSTPRPEPIPTTPPKRTHPGTYPHRQSTEPTTNPTCQEEEKETTPCE